MTKPEIWSSTDLPYMCLKDRERTLALRAAVDLVVKPGDRVIDIGAGTGILSFFAAQAGAASVHAVEIDPLLARCLHESISANGLDDRVFVVEGDVMHSPLPTGVDVVLAEIVDTALIDELLVPTLNDLRARGVISSNTRVVPQGYATTLAPASTTHEYYGFTITAPKHEWPFYAEDGRWHATCTTDAAPPLTICRLDLSYGPIDLTVSGSATIDVDRDVPINAIRIAGMLDLAPGITLGPTPSLNGDKIVHLPTIAGADRITLTWSYEMGGGLQSLQIRAQALGVVACP
jgi:predicted RNA methylase